MISALSRKLQNLRHDPTLRRWVIARLAGRVKTPTAVTAHVPPYLTELLPLSAEAPESTITATMDNAILSGRIRLSLAGKDVDVDATDIDGFFDTAHDDLETQLSVDRFAWLPVADESVTPAWVNALWQAWSRRNPAPGDGWAWHPYTAAERAINILDVAAKFGWPGDSQDTQRQLAAHAPVIAAKLEYFGEHNTSNHLANNGRGLYRLGVALNLADARKVGFEILRHEALRLVGPGGALREGSTHYHLLYVRNYADVWLCAQQAGCDDEAKILADILKPMAAAAREFMLNGGLPLIGDISPDIPPAFLIGLERGEGAWVAARPASDQRLLSSLTAEIPKTDTTIDGWHRIETGQWRALGFVPTDGWSPMPGHGHQDLGSFEIHFDSDPLFIDPGRGNYGETGDAARYRSAYVHGTLIVDGTEPAPINKPYYSAAFRHQVVPVRPVVAQKGDNNLILSHGGFQRRSGIGTVSREWVFEADRMVISDTVDGTRIAEVCRTFVTPMDVFVEGSTITLKGKSRSFRLRPEAHTIITVNPIILWHTYGYGHDGTQITLTTNASLPWQGRIDVEILN